MSKKRTYSFVTTITYIPLIWTQNQNEWILLIQCQPYGFSQYIFKGLYVMLNTYFYLQFFAPFQFRHSVHIDSTLEKEASTDYFLSQPSFPRWFRTQHQHLPRQPTIIERCWGLPREQQRSRSFGGKIQTSPFLSSMFVETIHLLNLIWSFDINAPKIHDTRDCSFDNNWFFHKLSRDHPTLLVWVNTVTFLMIHSFHDSKYHGN